MPKVDTSKLAIPSFGGATGSDENKEPLEAQEIRDEKAVDAKKKFVELDQKAQVRIDSPSVWVPPFGLYRTCFNNTKPFHTFVLYRKLNERQS